MSEKPSQIFFWYRSINVKLLHLMIWCPEQLHAMWKQEGISSYVLLKPEDLMKEKGILDEKIVFQVTVNIVAFAQAFGQNPLGFKAEVSCAVRFSGYVLNKRSVGSFKLIYEVMLPIGDQADCELVPQRMAGILHAHVGDIESSLSSAKPCQAEQLVLQSMQSRLRVRPQGGVPAPAIGIPVVNDREQDPHRDQSSGLNQCFSSCISLSARAAHWL